MSTVGAGVAGLSGGFWWSGVSGVRIHEHEIERFRIGVESERFFTSVGDGRGIGGGGAVVARFGWCGVADGCGA